MNGGSVTTPGERSPRVLHVDDGKGWRGGQHQVFLLMIELARRGVPQWLAARSGGPLARRALDAGFNTHEFRFLGELDFPSSYRVARLARAVGANIVHAHTGHAQAIGLRAARALGGDARMLTTRRVDFGIAHGFFSRRKYLNPAQHYIAISRAVRQALLDGGIAAEKIDLVASGVPQIPDDLAWPRERARAELGIRLDELAIVNIGALTDHKGHCWLIEATPDVVAAWPQARIHILGEGELRGELERRINALGLQERVILHGHVPDARLKLAGFDLFVSSSHLEGLGTVILDAMLASLPVVATAAGGVTDIVVDGETGWLAPTKNAKLLAQKIDQALRELDGDAGRGMVKNARLMVQRRYSAEAMAEGTLQVYRKLLAQ